MKYLDAKGTGKRIEEKTREHGYTVIQLSMELNVTTQAIYNWFSENKKAMPTVDNLVILSSLLDCTVDELLSFIEIEEEREL